MFPGGRLTARRLRFVTMLFHRTIAAPRPSLSAEHDTVSSDSAAVRFPAGRRRRDDRGQPQHRRRTAPGRRNSAKVPPSPEVEVPQPRPAGRDAGGGRGLQLAIRLIGAVGWRWLGGCTNSGRTLTRLFRNHTTRFFSGTGRRADGNLARVAAWLNHSRQPDLALADTPGPLSPGYTGGIRQVYARRIEEILSGASPERAQFSQSASQLEAGTWAC